MNTHAPVQKRQHEESAPQHAGPGKSVQAADVGLPLFMQANPTASAGVTLQRKCACGGTPGANDECETCNSGKPLQTKLSIGASNDPLEQEADRVADQVLAMPANPTVSVAPPRIQRYTGQATEETDTVPPSIERVLASSGRPLEPALQQDMEQRFGHDFSQVRVHSDGAAEQSARDVHANAYTVGHDIVFGEDRYAPDTYEGQRLIAHELTHVVQQAGTEGMRASRSGEKRGLSPIPRMAEPTAVGTRLQRACGPAKIGSQAYCIGRGGDITDFGGDSGKIFRFRAGCDDLLPGEEARVQDLASTLSSDNQLGIDGFASEEGPADFNENLSCARAKALASALVRAGVSASQFVGIYMHGATPGSRTDRRSAVISIWASVAAAPEPKSAPPAERTREKVIVWLNAFIPRDIPGLTKPVPRGPFTGHTMFKGPPLFDCFLTDNRDFSSASDAKARMRQGLVIDVDSLQVTQHIKYSDPTYQIDCDGGHEVCGSAADPTISYSVLKHTADTLIVEISGAGSNPCVRPSPNIDFDGKLLLSKKSAMTSIAFMGRVDEFPAFEMYALSTTKGKPEVVFRSMPPAGNTPFDLVGPPPLSREGFVGF